jgi:hypothetical protein
MPDPLTRYAEPPSVATARLHAESDRGRAAPGRMDDRAPDEGKHGSAPRRRYRASAAWCAHLGLQCELAQPRGPC